VLIELGEFKAHQSYEIEKLIKLASSSLEKKVHSKNRFKTSKKIWAECSVFEMSEV
jgi:hypothetical protein